MSNMSLYGMADCILIVYDYGEMFDCIITVYELGRNGLLFTYHISVIWVCRTWLIVYLSYTIMGKYLIVYLPWHELGIYVDCARTINEGSNFIGHGWLYTYRIRLWINVLIVYFSCMSLNDMVDCTLTIYEWYEFVRHGWLYTYCIKLWGNIWLFTYRIWACKTWLNLHIPYISDINL